MQPLLAGVLVAGVSASLSLAIVLAVQADHSVASAGGIAAAYAGADGAIIPARGRLIDRRGQRVLLPLAGAHALFLGALALLVPAWPVWALGALAALSGATNAPLFPSLRVLWRQIASDERELEAAYSLQVVLTEALFVSAPLVVAGLGALASARQALAAVAACQLVGTGLFATSSSSRGWRSEARTARALGALASSGVRTLALGALGNGFVLGALEVGAVALARDHGHPGQGALALSALGIGSVVGGLAYGALRWRKSLHRRYVVLAAVLAGMMTPVGLAPSLPPLAGYLLVVGLVIAPWVAVSLSLLDRVAPVGTATESTTWLIAAYAAGAAVGSAVAGQLADRAGPAWALEAAVLGAIAALGVTLVRFSSLAGDLEERRFTGSQGPCPGK